MSATERACSRLRVRLPRGITRSLAVLAGFAVGACADGRDSVFASRNGAVVGAPAAQRAILIGHRKQARDNAPRVVCVEPRPLRNGSDPADTAYRTGGGKSGKPGTGTPGPDPSLHILYLTPFETCAGYLRGEMSKNDYVAALAGYPRLTFAVSAMLALDRLPPSKAVGRATTEIVSAIRKDRAAQKTCRILGRRPPDPDARFSKLHGICIPLSAGHR